MRIVFVGASKVTVGTAKALIDKDHEVVIIEINKARIDELSEEMDCSFLQGDGSIPDVLREVNPAQTHMLFCLTNNDQINLIASLVGRSLGFRRVVTSIANPQFEGICRELDLKDTIIPSRTISLILEDMVSGGAPLDLSTVIKEEARFFTFVAGPEDARLVKDMELPDGARIVCYYREGRFTLAEEETKLRRDDEIVILTHSRNVPALEQRWPAAASPDKVGEESENHN